MYMQLLEQYPTHMTHFTDNATKQYASKLFYNSSAMITSNKYAYFPGVPSRRAN